MRRRDLIGILGSTLGTWATQARAQPPGDANLAPLVGSGWPNASNTGVPAGTVLTPHVGNITARANQTFENLDITGVLTVRVTGVTVKNCRVNGNRDYYCIDANQYPVTVIDSELYNSNMCGSICKGGNFLRCNIWETQKGVTLQGGDTVQDCYIHDLIDLGNHPNSVEIYSGSNFTVRHCYMTSPGTSCVIVATNWPENIQNVMIDSNCCRTQIVPQKCVSPLYCYQRGAGYGTLSNITFQNNVLEKGYAGAYIELMNYVPVWINNTDYYTGAQIRI
jgi:Right handed beta helix region